MCGIAGYFLKKGQTAPAGLLSLFADLMHHRGPDGVASQVIGQAGFVHTRLAIVDLAGGRQPFCRGQAMMMANGEIYNHPALRAGLAEQDQPDSASDCAVLLPLWQRDGPPFVQALQGMYAIAGYDGQHDTGLLARDPFGIKPLYYIEAASGLYFASEPSVLRKAGLVDDRPDRLLAAAVLDRQFHGGADCLSGRIKRLQPGELLQLKSGEISQRHWDRPLDQPAPASFMANESGNETGNDLGKLDEMLARTVSAHQMADVPFGAFLSGGIDSSVILAMMARLNSGPVLAYTARFEDAPARDETSLARQVALQCGAEFIDCPYGRADFFASAGAAVAACDDPAADYAILPSLHLARRAARDVKVVLSGEGGDEFFAGYGRYRSAMRLVAARQLARPGPALKSGLLKPDMARQMTDYLASLPAGPSLGQRLGQRDQALRLVQRADIDSWLPDNLLIKLDRCLMHASVEGRTPFIDRHLSSWAYHLPARAKLAGKHGKYILQSWLAEHLPAARPFQRKRGFSVPAGHWIAAEADRLAPLLARLPLLSSVVDSAMIHPLLAAGGSKAGLLAWRVVFLGLWEQIHLNHIAADQPLDDILAAR